MKQLNHFRNKVKTHNSDARNSGIKTRLESCRSSRFIRTGLLGKINSSIALAFALMLLLQSCALYYKDPISKEQASYSKDPLKLKMDGKDYKIEALKYNDSSTIAIAKDHSKLAKRHPELVINQSDKIVQVDLSNKEIESIRQKDVKNSTTTSILLGVAAAGAVAVGAMFPILFYGVAGKFLSVVAIL